MRLGDPVDVSSWPVDAAESRGKREKAWLINPTTRARWLWKRPSVSPGGARRSEPAIEVAMLRLAQAGELLAPDAHLAVRTVDDVTMKGIVVRSFLGAYQQLNQGIDLLRGRFPDYDPDDYSAHTLDRIRHVLDGYPEAEELESAFVRMVLFDAWIGNSDRHQENWGTIVGGGAVQLAPIYDPAACLGVELTDDHPMLDEKRRTDERVAGYIVRCRSGFGAGRELIHQRAVVAAIRAWPRRSRPTGCLRPVDNWPCCCSRGDSPG